MALKQVSTGIPSTLNLDSLSERSLVTIIHVKSDANSATSKKPCPICMENYPHEEFDIPFLTCPHRFCKNCLTEYIKEKINNFQVLKIRCPQEGCDGILSSKTLNDLLDEQTFKNYENLVLKKLTLSNPKHRLCPMPGCTFQLPISNKLPQTKCKCGAVVCNVCGSLWHEGKTCLESIDADFQTFSSEHEIKFCAVCKTTVKKIEGCKHITCPICDYEWCWDCGRQHSNTHAKECPGTWDPLPPTNRNKLWKEKWSESSIFTKIIITILLIPFLPLILVGLLIFWPLCYSFNPSEDLSWDSPCQSLIVIIFSLILGLFFLPVVLMGIFIILCFLVLLMPIFLVAYIIEWIRPSQAQRSGSIQTEPQGPITNRWITGNPSFFKYTTKSRPTVENQPATTLNPNENNNIEQGSDSNIGIEMVQTNKNQISKDKVIDLENGNKDRQNLEIMRGTLSDLDVENDGRNNA